MGKAFDFMADVDELIEEMGKLTLMEAVNLVKQLEAKWGVSLSDEMKPLLSSSSSIIIMDDVKDSFDIILVSVLDSSKRVSVIKVIRELKPGVGLSEAMALVSGSKILFEGIDREFAESVKNKLESAGASVEIR